jgi:hypothetical protein
MALTINIFQGEHELIDAGSAFGQTTAATWPAGTSTLVAGERKAIHVDALIARRQGQQAASWSSTSLKRVLVTNGHGGHTTAGLDLIAAILRQSIVSGCRDPATSNDGATRRRVQARGYIRAFDRSVEAAGSGNQLVDGMVHLHPYFGGLPAPVSCARPEFATAVRGPASMHSRVKLGSCDSGGSDC